MSGLKLTLQDMLHFIGLAPSKVGFRIVFEADKVVLTIHGHYIGKYYLDNGFFKLKAINVLLMIK